ncbi:acyl carrier protein [Rhizobium sp. PP-CC-3G-465]|uniref:acyl carrier protein n=1 Tax=Rhizobium sp. PP-CC-3G-465 TaxID=2135648 RepID=UPI00104EC206|nr:phosphopantetheine binding protein [Rhizobium sp. PP-CC-3G-465]
MKTQIREMLAQYASLPSAAGLDDDADLYAAGMSSHGSVQLMLALEDTFDVEFPDNLLNRKSFSTIAIIEQTVNQLVAAKEAA